MKGRGTRCGFTLVELLAGVAIIGVLGALLLAAGWKVYENSSLAVSANNIRQLAAGSSSYLADNNYVFWRPQQASRGDLVVWVRTRNEPRAS